MGKKGELFVGLFIAPIKVESDEIENVLLKTIAIFLFSNFETKMWLPHNFEL